MTFKEIKELIEVLKESNLAEFNYRKDEFELKIKTDKFSRKVTVAPSAGIPQSIQVATPTPNVQPEASSSAPSPENASEVAPIGANIVEVKSPIVGTFYRSPGPDKDAFVRVGDRIEVGSVVCIVEAMKLFNEIESEVAGTIVKMLVDDASPVEYDQPLFLVEI